MNSQKKILLVEDEPNVGSTLSEKLDREQYAVTWIKSAGEFQAKISLPLDFFDLAVLDVGLPDGSGFDIAKTIRNLSPETAIIFLTAFRTPEDRIHGLELGAEDYVVKPFHLKELTLRIQNSLRRRQSISSTQNPEVRLGKAVIHFQRFEAVSDGKKQPLTHKEVSLLRFLLERKGEVISRNEILDNVWSPDEFPTSRTVDNFILRIRKIIEENPEKPTIIKSIRGVGYQLL